MSVCACSNPTPAGLLTPDHNGAAAWPLVERLQRLPRKVFRSSIAWLSDSLSPLRRTRCHVRRKTRFRPLVRRYRTGFHPQGSAERFQSCFLHLIPLSQAYLAQRSRPPPQTCARRRAQRFPKDLIGHTAKPRAGFGQFAPASEGVWPESRRLLRGRLRYEPQVRKMPQSSMARLPRHRSGHSTSAPVKATRRPSSPSWSEMSTASRSSALWLRRRTSGWSHSATTM